MKGIIISLFLTLLLAGLPEGVMGQQKKATDLLSLAKEQMAREDYQAANGSFREMLKLKTVLPTEMCYYFASTLYMLGQYENSLRFTEKYLTLAGAGGEFYKDSQTLKGLLDEKMAVIRTCSLCDSKGYVLESCPNCDEKGQLTKSCTRCYGRVQVKCTACEGEGVVIEKNHFGQQTYHTCQRCEGAGIQQCPQCNGTGQTEQDCRFCQGSGFIATTVLCEHPTKIP